LLSVNLNVLAAPLKQVAQLVVKCKHRVKLIRVRVIEVGEGYGFWVRQGLNPGEQIVF